MNETSPGPGERPGGPLAQLLDVLPAGHAIPDDAWLRRHRVMIILLWLHAMALVIVGLLFHNSPLHSVAEGGIVALAALLAGQSRFSRNVRMVIASLGLLTSSAVLVHLTGGYIEVHFHFFVTVTVIALYQAWLPFLVAVVYVFIHHGLIGTLYPTAVYNHPGAWEHPWHWAAVHSAFILASTAMALVNWRMKEIEHGHRVVAQRLATTDSQTGLLNHRGIHEVLDREIAHARAHRGAVGVMMIDVDDLKVVNDRFGHLAGDRVLQAASDLLSASVRDVDAVGRYGGDEFLLVLPDADGSTVAQVAERILARAASVAVPLGEQRVPLKLSVGAASYPADGEAQHDLIAHADKAMYAAKANGNGGRPGPSEVGHAVERQNYQPCRLIVAESGRLR